MTYVAAFYVQQHGFSTQEVGWTYLVCRLGVLLGQILAGGRIGRKPRTVVIWSRMLSGVFMGSALFLPIPALATVVVATLGLIANGASNVATGCPAHARGANCAGGIPATLAQPGAETPISVVLEAPFWTGIPSLIGALIGAGLRALADRRAHSAAHHPT